MAHGVAVCGEQQVGQSFIVLGHSLVAHLNSYMDAEGLQNMGMNVETVHLYGFPGATTRALMYRIPELFNNNTVSSPSPIAACIQIGGNDLASFNVTPPMVFQDIRDLVLLLIDTYNIKQVNSKRAGGGGGAESAPPGRFAR